MTHKEALERINQTLNKESTTWQEKKNQLADFVIEVSQRCQPNSESVRDQDYRDWHGAGVDRWLYV